tara:strand:- start:131 stop:385 length:255 start_codon:yes stop_codon:yes gene_type:complete
MKKVLISVLLLSSCKLQENKVYVTERNISKCVHNLEILDNLIIEDFQNGDIEKHCYDLYRATLYNTTWSLKAINKKHKPNTKSD